MPEEKAIRPFGLWSSPINAAILARHPEINDVQWTPDGNGLVWLENRDGKSQLVYMPQGEIRQELVTGHKIHGGVGYGGGDFGVGRDEVFFADSRGVLYRRSFSAGQPEGLTPAYGGLAAPVVSPSGRWVLYVHSNGSEDVLALVDANGRERPAKLTGGADFYMQPVWNPSEDAIAWVEWDHPNMPWDSTRLKIGLLAGDPPRIQTVQLIAGNAGETVVQPRFSPDGRYLSYIISRGEWEALEVMELATGQRRTWLEGEFQLSSPAWVQGQHTYGWSSSGKTIFSLRNAFGKSQLCSIDSSGNVQIITTEPYTWLEQLSVSPAADEFALIASSPTQPQQVVRGDGQHWQVVAYSDTPVLLPSDLPDPQQVEWQTSNGQKVYGFFSAPANSRFTGEGLPPLIVNIHGGPTSQSKLVYPRDAHYFTSRGYAWLEVNYRGSSGYGRSYREALYGQWGNFDVEDAVSGAQALAARGLVDGGKMVIFGGSSGGLTVLLALARHPGVFKAGVALYPVINLFTLGLETHKFEQHYDEKLVGKLPEAADIYRERSPMFHAEKIKDPLAIFHGTDDRAVPINQSQAIVERLRSAGVPHLFHVYEGEGHGFKNPESLLDLYPRIERFLKEKVLFA